MLQLEISNEDEDFTKETICDNIVARLKEENLISFAKEKQRWDSNDKEII